MGNRTKFNAVSHPMFIVIGLYRQNYSGVSTHATNSDLWLHEIVIYLYLEGVKQRKNTTNRLVSFFGCYHGTIILQLRHQRRGGSGLFLRFVPGTPLPCRRTSLLLYLLVLLHCGTRCRSRCRHGAAQLLVEKSGCGDAERTVHRLLLQLVREHLAS